MVFEKNFVVIMALMIVVVGVSGSTLPSTSSKSSSLPTDTPSVKTTPQPSTTTSPKGTILLSTASTTSTTTEKPFGVIEQTTTTTIRTTTSTSPPRVTTKDTKAEHGKSGKADDESTDNTTIIIVACCIGGFILLVIVIVVAVCLILRCSKKRRAAKSKKPQAEPTQQHGTKTQTEFKTPTGQKTPTAPTSPWAPEHIPAEKFKYEGPLVLQTKPPTELPMVHELDNERPPSIHDSHHVEFDDEQNVAVEIGSEVEVFMDGDKKMPQKARSSVPSPYAEPAGSSSGKGRKMKRAAAEKKMDKAIRE